MEILYIVDKEEGPSGIEKVFARPVVTNQATKKSEWGSGKWYSKYRAAEMIRKGEATFRTAWKGNDEKWVLGQADIHVVGDIYLRTDGNKTEKDNLSNM